KTAFSFRHFPTFYNRHLHTSQQSSEDLRCKELILTDQARTLISQINNARCELIEARCQCLSEVELDNLNQLLDKLNQRRISL
ncbi:hypothetical protein AAGX74_08835, partial [Staphylococcus aureus]